MSGVNPLGGSGQIPGEQPPGRRVLRPTYITKPGALPPVPDRSINASASPPSSAAPADLVARETLRRSSSSRSEASSGSGSEVKPVSHGSKPAAVAQASQQHEYMREVLDLEAKKDPTLDEKTRLILLKNWLVNYDCEKISVKKSEYSKNTKQFIEQETKLTDQFNKLIKDNVQGTDADKSKILELGEKIFSNKLNLKGSLEADLKEKIDAQKVREQLARLEKKPSPTPEDHLDMLRCRNHLLSYKFHLFPSNIPIPKHVEILINKQNQIASHNDKKPVSNMDESSKKKYLHQLSDLLILRTKIDDLLQNEFRIHKLQGLPSRTIDEDFELLYLQNTSLRKDYEVYPLEHKEISEQTHKLIAEHNELCEHIAKFKMEDFAKLAQAEKENHVAALGLILDARKAIKASLDNDPRSSKGRSEALEKAQSKLNTVLTKHNPTFEDSVQVIDLKFEIADIRKEDAQVRLNKIGMRPEDFSPKVGALLVNIQQLRAQIDQLGANRDLSPAQRQEYLDLGSKFVALNEELVALMQADLQSFDKSKAIKYFSDLEMEIEQKQALNPTGIELIELKKMQAALLDHKIANSGLSKENSSKQTNALFQRDLNLMREVSKFEKMDLSNMSDADKRDYANLLNKIVVTRQALLNRIHKDLALGSDAVEIESLRALKSRTIAQDIKFYAMQINEVRYELRKAIEKTAENEQTNKLLAQHQAMNAKVIALRDSERYYDENMRYLDSLKELLQISRSLLASLAK